MSEENLLDRELDYVSKRERDRLQEIYGIFHTIFSVASDDIASESARLEFIHAIAKKASLSISNMLNAPATNVVPEVPQKP